MALATIPINIPETSCQEGEASEDSSSFEDFTLHAIVGNMGEEDAMEVLETINQ